jgi:hypothetical protein
MSLQLALRLRCRSGCGRGLPGSTGSRPRTGFPVPAIERAAVFDDRWLVLAPEEQPAASTLPLDDPSRKAWSPSRTAWTGPNSSRDGSPHAMCVVAAAELKLRRDVSAATDGRSRAVSSFARRTSICRQRTGASGPAERSKKRLPRGRRDGSRARCRCYWGPFAVSAA